MLVILVNRYHKVLEYSTQAVPSVICYSTVYLDQIPCRHSKSRPLHVISAARLLYSRHIYILHCTLCLCFLISSRYVASLVVLRSPLNITLPRRNLNKVVKLFHSRVHVCSIVCFIRLELHFLLENVWNLN